MLAHPVFYPVKQSAVEAYAGYEETPDGWCREAGFVSNGAYMCTGYEKDTSITYEKNPYYWDAQNVKTGTPEVSISDDVDGNYQVYQEGNADFVNGITDQTAASLIEAGDSELHIDGILGTYFMYFSVKSPIFEGKTPEQAVAVRKAVSLLMDRQAMAGNTGQKAADALAPYGIQDGNGNLYHAEDQRCYYDPLAINKDYNGTVARAVELLKQAGYQFGSDGKLSEETPLTIRYLANKTSEHQMIAAVLQEDLAAVGIRVNVTLAS